MSLQALKLKSGTINSPHARTDGFTLHGGQRNGNYIGKSMRNSPNGTRYKGVYPVNFSQTVGTISNGTMCKQITELRGNPPKMQPSVGNNHSMIYSRNKWIKGSVYPNISVQTTTPMGYNEYNKIVRFREDCNQQVPDSQLSKGGEECCSCEKSFPLPEVQIYRSRLERLKRCNDGIIKPNDPEINSSSQYTSRMQFKCIEMIDPLLKDKPNAPNPPYTTNPSVLNTGVISCGAASCGGLV